jgi:CBS domain-containing protein
MLFVENIMSRRVKTVASVQTIRSATKKMVKAKTGSLIVVDALETVGIMTEGDVSKAIAKGLDPDRNLVKEIMSKRLITTSPDTRVEDAAKLMADSGVKKLPVMEDGKLVGIVTQTDIVASSFDLVTSLKEMVRARYRPPDFQP